MYQGILIIGDLHCFVLKVLPILDVTLANVFKEMFIVGEECRQVS